MEIIAEIEGERRGPYGGAVGYFSYSGDMDTALVLRTGIYKDGTMYVQAGGGIVADSVARTSTRRPATSPGRSCGPSTWQRPVLNHIPSPSGEGKVGVKSSASKTTEKRGSQPC